MMARKLLVGNNVYFSRVNIQESIVQAFTKQWMGGPIPDLPLR
jgi:hypothetical protein